MISRAVFHALVVATVASPPSILAEVSSQSMELVSSAGKHKITVISSQAAGAGAPAFVYFGSASDNNANPDPAPLLSYLAEQGIKAFQVEYANPLPLNASRDFNSLTNAIKETKAALAAIRKDAGKFGIDPDHIIAAGLGDGGYFAMMAGLDKQFEPEGMKQEDWKPNAIVAMSPFMYQEGDLPNIMGGSIFYQRYGAENLKKLQPIRLISSGAPPMLLCGMDRHTNLDEAEYCRYKVAADKAQSRCDLVVYFKMPFRDYFRFKDFNQHVQFTVHSFLNSVGYLPGKPSFEAPLLHKSKELFAAREGYHVKDPQKTITVLADDSFGSPNDVDISQIVYRKQDSTLLHLLVFRKKGSKPDPQNPLPAFVYFHGGGWVGGSYYDWLGHSKDVAYLTRRGMVGFEVEYRTNQHKNPYPQECLKDCKAAIRYIRQHAAELGVDPNRIAASGGSAGGHLSAALGTVQGFEHSGQNLKISSRPNALVLLSPVMDNGPWGYKYEVIKKDYPAFSPINNLSKDTPPILEFSGVTEGIVPKDSTAYLKHKMDSLGVRCDLNVMMKGGHAQQNPTANGPEIAKYIMWKTDKFFCELGWLKGEPAMDISKFKNSPLLELWVWKTSPYGLDYIEKMQERAAKGEFKNRVASEPVE